MFTAATISSTHRKMMSTLRRISTPIIPMMNSAALEPEKVVDGQIHHGAPRS